MVFTFPTYELYLIYSSSLSNSKKFQISKKNNYRVSKNHAVTSIGSYLLYNHKLLKNKNDRMSKIINCVN